MTSITVISELIAQSYKYRLNKKAPSSPSPTMTSIIDPNTIGKPVRPRRHVRTLTGMSLSPQLNQSQRVIISRLSARGGRIWQGEMA
jgi:hypothetical protein